jgi:hypothetical protein
MLSSCSLVYFLCLCTGPCYLCSCSLYHTFIPSEGFHLMWPEKVIVFSQHKSFFAVICENQNTFRHHTNVSKIIILRLCASLSRHLRPTDQCSMFDCIHQDLGAARLLCAKRDSGLPCGRGGGDSQAAMYFCRDGGSL